MPERPIPTKCPRCAGTGTFYGDPCRLCSSTGRVNSIVAFEWRWPYALERIEAWGLGVQP